MIKANEIPLTPEILAKCGFSEVAMNIYSLPPLTILREGDIFIVIDFQAKENINVLTGRITIKYLHQLQNLYFDLTGKKLTYSTENKKR